MKYSDFVKTILLTTIDELLSQPEKYAEKLGRDFTRCRKISAKSLLLIPLIMEKDCIKEELYRYFGRKTDVPSKAAFYKQRQKLRSDALRALLLAFNRKLKNNLFNGTYQLVACDGSTADIHRDPKDPDTFFEPNKKSPKGFNQIYMNAFFPYWTDGLQILLFNRAENETSTVSFARWWTLQAVPAFLLFILATWAMPPITISPMSLKTASIS